MNAEWKGKKRHFIAVKRSGKRGEKIIFLVANFKTKSRIYHQIYDSRWGVEKFIRTGKQTLGLSKSAACDATVYQNHIKCVLFAYGITQLIMKKLRLDSPEKAILKAQALKYKYRSLKKIDLISLLEYHA